MIWETRALLAAAKTLFCDCRSGSCNGSCVPIGCLDKCQGFCDTPGGLCCAGKGALSCIPDANGGGYCDLA